MGFNSAFKGLKDKNRIRQTHRLLCGGYMFRTFIGSSSGLHTTNDVFDVHCFYLLTFKLLTHRDDFNETSNLNLVID